MKLTSLKERLKKENKKHIIFDLDNTICKLLVNWDPWAEKMQSIFSYYNIKFDPENVNYAKTGNLCIKKHGEEVRNKIIKVSEESEQNYFSGYKLNPTAIELLGLAREFAKVYLWTSNCRKTVLPILKELEINNFFEKIVTRNDVILAKPSAEGFSLIYDMGNKKSEYVLIGDSDADAGAAKEAGIDFININKIT